LNCDACTRPISDQQDTQRHLGVTKYCDEYVCMSVCLSARTSLENHTAKLQLFYARCLWPWLGPPQTQIKTGIGGACAICGDTLCTSGFVDDVMFSYNGLMARHAVIEHDRRHNSRDSNQILLSDKDQKLAVWRSGSVVRRMNEVTLR